MTRTTAADVRAALTKATHAATLAGLDASRWALVEGSATYGRAYRLHDRDDVTGGLSSPRGLDSFLGLTRREAVATLDAYRAAFLAISDARREATP